MSDRYKRMIDRMRAKETGALKKPREKWFLYILKCADQSLYTGITKDLKRRFKMHSEGKAARYTRTRRPLAMVYQEVCRSRTEALTREYFVKALPKPKKLILIEKNSPKIGDGRRRKTELKDA